MINVAIYNRASTPLPFALPAQVAAMQRFLQECFEPIWEMQITLAVTDGPVKGEFGLVFMDNADAPGALAYHDDDSGMPVAKVFVKTTLDAGQDVSVSASHELVEMLCDAACNRYVTEADDKTLMSLEVADPVEDQFFQVGGFNMTNFVTPAWFDPHTADGTKLDYLGKLTKPFELSAGGYAVVHGVSGWQQIFGSDQKAETFKTQDRRGRRGWLRAQRSRISKPSTL